MEELMELWRARIRALEEALGEGARGASADRMAGKAAALRWALTELERTLREEEKE